MGQESHLAAYGLLAGFAAVALWETLRPLRVPVLSTVRRWISHALLWLVSNAAGLWFFRVAGVLLASATPAGGILGLGTNDHIPVALRVLLAILLLDLLRYGQHCLFHAVPLLWRIHQVHHADADYDVTTGLRFHPFEAVLEQAALAGAILLFGPPPLAVAAFGLIGTLQDMFVHANASSPRLEKLLAYLLITPNMHRLHHSTSVEEQNRNFGFIFPWWDRLFRTYSTSSGRPFRTGLEGYQDDRSVSLWRMLAMPIWGGPGEVAPATAGPPLDTVLEAPIRADELNSPGRNAL